MICLRVRGFDAVDFLGFCLLESFCLLIYLLCGWFVDDSYWGFVMFVGLYLRVLSGGLVSMVYFGVYLVLWVLSFLYLPRRLWR